MIDKFNQLMHGFIEEDVTLEWLLENPEGILRNGSSSCRYKLKEIEGEKVLGAYGISRFTNWRFHEIAASGEINYEWFLQEGYNLNDPDSKLGMEQNNREGMERIKAFGISNA